MIYLSDVCTTNKMAHKNRTSRFVRVVVSRLTHDFSVLGGCEIFVLAKAAHDVWQNVVHGVVPTLHNASRFWSLMVVDVVVGRC